MIESVSKNVVLYIDDGIKIEYQRGKLIYSNEHSIHNISLYNKGLKKWVCKIRIFERLFRLQPRCIIKVSNLLFLISYNKGLYIYNVNKNKIELYYKYSCGTNNPLSFCQYNRKNVVETIFGDYGGHDADGNVGIYRFKISDSNLEDNVEKISSINGNEIDHIHRIEYDKYRDCYWIFTGDDDKGSCIWKMDYSDNKIEKFLYGKQLFRSCVSFITESKILYITDCPNEQNYVVEVDIKTRKYQKIQKVVGSCIYGDKINYEKNLYCFSTTVEPNTKMSKIRYLFTYEIGQGIQDKYSHLYIGNENGFKDVFNIKKDILPMLLFQFGNIVFPKQNIKNYVYFYFQSCKNDGYMTKRIFLTEGGNKC